MFSRHVNFFQSLSRLWRPRSRRQSRLGTKKFTKGSQNFLPRRIVGETMQILPTIVEKAYQLARAWKRRKVVLKT